MAHVLIIDRELTLAADLAEGLTRAISRAPAVTTEVEVTAEADFSKARARIKKKPPSLLVTALQLGEYNGMHLVYMAAASGFPTRSVVHTENLDAVQAREVRSAGAFYELRGRLPAALHAYVMAVLPAEDRRDPMRFDRRRLARGGRRAADVRPAAALYR